MRLDDRMNAIAAALAAALPARMISRALKHFSDQAAADLEKGIVMLVAGGEGDYKGVPGFTAAEGALSLLCVGNVKCAEAASPLDVENAEIALIEELKAAFTQPPAGMQIRPVRLEQSRQLEAPYGWFVLFAEVTKR